MTFNKVAGYNVPAKTISFVALAVLHFASLPAAYAVPDEENRKVLVNSVRGPELKSYRTMSAGLDAFEENRALAPRAPEVRFRLRPLTSNPDVDMRDLGLRIAGNTMSIPLPLAADNTFLLPRSEAAADEDADLVLNKKRGDYRWEAMVNSPGVPAGMRRLGDLRLECQVEVAIGKKELGVLRRAAAATIFGSSDWCRTADFEITTIGARPIASATLILGERRIALPVKFNRMAFTTPPEGQKLPDDALIEIKYADEAKAD